MTAPATPTQEAFLSEALDRLNEVARDRAERISAAEEGLLSTLWAAIIVACRHRGYSPRCSASPTCASIT